MQKLLITGAAGFLGGHIAKHFSTLGWETFGIDRKDPLEPGFSGFKVLDLTDPTLASAISSFAPEIIFHAAGRASPARSMTHPTEDFSNNVTATQCLLDSVRFSGLRPRIIFCSSAAVYGQPAQLPVAEGSQVAPLSPYGFHKHLAEWLFREYERVYAIPSTILRIFSVYGPGLRRQVVYDLIHRASTEHRLQLHGTGRETRDFIYIRDFCQCVETVVLSEQCPQTVNVASGIETSLHELAALVADFCKIDSDPTFDLGSQPGMPDRWRADISELSKLGFHPGVSFRDGVDETVNWYQTTQHV